MARQATDARRTTNQLQHQLDHSSGSAHKPPPPDPSSVMATSLASSSAAARSYAKYLRAAKRHHHAPDLRESTSSTASTVTSSTRMSDVSSVSAMSSVSDSSSSRRHSRTSCQSHRSSSSSGRSHDDAFRSISPSLARHEAASRRRGHSAIAQPPPPPQTQQLVHEHDPDYLPIDSTQYKHAVQQKKQKRAQRIKLKHYGLAKQAAKMNNLSGFLLHSITPRESSILTYTSMASPGTHTEYDIVVENVRTGMIWQVSRRYSTFRLLREELLKPFQSPHCHYCASVMHDMQKLEQHFPGKRLWGSTSPAVVRGRAERFHTYLHGLLAMATSTYKLNCRIIANYFVVQLRNFLTTESVRYNGIPGAYGDTIPSLLRELSTPRSSRLQDPGAMTLQTIQEHSSRSSRGSLFDDSVDEKDFRDKLRLADEHDSYYGVGTGGGSDYGCGGGDRTAAALSSTSSAATTRSSGQARGLDAYLQEEDDDGWSDSDDGSDGDDDAFDMLESDDDDQQQQFAVERVGLTCSV